MTRLVLCAFAALVAAIGMVCLEPGARAQGMEPRWFEAQPREDRGYRSRRVVEDDDDAYFRQRLRAYRRDAIARRGPPERYERRPMRRVEEERPSGGFGVPFLRRLFGGGDQANEETYRARADPGAVEVRPTVRRPRRRPPPAPVEARAAPPAAAAAAAAAALAPATPGIPVAPILPQAPTPPTTFVAVIGDSIADGLAGGLADGFADAPELAVRRVVKPNSGLVRDDYFDFVGEARKALESGPVTYAVFDVGVNDRQPFLDMRKEPPLSDPWRKRYAERVDAVLAPFKERKVPIYWVGLAASESRRASADHTAINAIAKERVEAAGGTYVDVWEGFVDEDGAYAAFGPQLDGQMGRLRLDDGVHYSKAGARKLAHYVEQEIRKVFQPKPVTPEAVMAAASFDPGAAAPQPGPAAEKPRPISSAPLVLTAPSRAANGALAAAAPLVVPARDASASASRVLVTGETLDADPGRMDDHRWPGAEQPAPPAGAAAQVAPLARPADPAQPAPAR